jgi:hypothetical protein
MTSAPSSRPRPGHYPGNTPPTAAAPPPAARAPRSARSGHEPALARAGAPNTAAGSAGTGTTADARQDCPSPDWPTATPRVPANLEGGTPSVQLFCLRRAGIPPAQSTSGAGGGPPPPATAATPAAGWHIGHSQLAASLAPRLAITPPGSGMRRAGRTRRRATGSADLIRHAQRRCPLPPAACCPVERQDTPATVLDPTSCDQTKTPQPRALPPIEAVTEVSVCSRAAPERPAGPSPSQSWPTSPADAATARQPT